MENSLDIAIKHGVKDILVSALYMSKKKASMEVVLSNFDFVFLDSGAFTFWNKWYDIQEKHLGSEKFNDKRFLAEWHKTQEAIDMFAKHKAWGAKWEEEYLAMLKSDKRFLNRDIVHVVEYDIGNEYEMTERRKRFEKEGFNVVPVFHPNDSKEYADMLIRDYDYVGIGGIAVASGRYQAKDFQQYFKKMKESHTKVHGFGMTQQEPMRRMPFYSVDSTSWLSGARYGTTYEFRNGQLKVYNNKDVRKRFKRRCEELGVNYDALLADDGKTVNEWNMLQWKLYGDWLTTSPMKKKQEYWHDTVHGGEIKKVVNIDFETYEKEVIILNGKGEVYNPEDYKRSEEEITDLVVAEENLPSTKEGVLDIVGKGLYMECDSCTLGDRCPLYREGNICGIPSKEINGANDFGDVMKILFNLQQKRILLGAMQESQDGGILDERLSKEIDRMMNMMQRFRDLVDPQDTLEIKAKGSASGGILAQIFGIKNEKEA